MRFFLDLYVLSLHWSLTQFTPATTDIAPANSLERLFACLIVLFAMVTFSSFISNVTNTVNQLKVLNARKLNEEGLIRKFLQQRRISTDVGGRIQQFFQMNFNQRHGRVQET